jgi:hypothetical protein
MAYSRPPLDLGLFPLRLSMYGPAGPGVLSHRAAEGCVVKMVARVAGAAMVVAIMSSGLVACGGTDDCYTTGEPGSAQEERDLERAARAGCDEVRDESL